MADSTVERAELVRALGATVGDAKAADAVDAAARAMGLYGTLFTHDEAVELLDRLAAAPDVLGIAAKLLRVRLVLGGK